MNLDEIRAPDSMESYRRFRRFIPPDDCELFCVTNAERQWMSPATEWFFIPIPEHIKRPLRYGDVLTHKRDADGTWRWYVEGVLSKLA